MQFVPKFPLTPAGAFALNLGGYMQERGLTPTTVARRAGLSPSAVHNYLNLRGLPRPKKRPDLAAALGVQLSELESWLKGEVVVPSMLLVANNTLEDTLAEVRGALLKMPPQRWPIVVEIVRQVGRV